MLEMFFVFMPKLIYTWSDWNQSGLCSFTERSLYGNDRFPYKERGPTERERLLKVIFNALDVNYWQLMTIVFQSCLTVWRSLRVLLASGRSPRHQRNRHIVIPIEPYYEHEKHFEHVLCFSSQVHETFYTSIETTCIDRETILYRNLRWLTPWPFKHSEGH